MFDKASYKGVEEKESWQKIMRTRFISSDESRCEDGVDVLITKSLPWQSQTMTLFKEKLDLAALGEKTPLARRQMK